MRDEAQSVVRRPDLAVNNNTSRTAEARPIFICSPLGGKRGGLRHLASHFRLHQSSPRSILSTPFQDCLPKHRHWTEPAETIQNAVPRRSLASIYTVGYTGIIFGRGSTKVSYFAEERVTLDALPNHMTPCFQVSPPRNAVQAWECGSGCLTCSSVSCPACSASVISPLSSMTSSSSSVAWRRRRRRRPPVTLQCRTRFTLVARNNSFTLSQHHDN